MPNFKQAGRFLTVTTPLGPDALLAVGLEGTEALSQLFAFRLDLIAENTTTVPFDAVLGRAMTAALRLEDGSSRYFSGICARLSRGRRDEQFTAYRAEVMPEAWLLTRRSRCRVFQQTAVPEILRQVFAGLDAAFELSDTYRPRDYCVQYRETDFDFAARLMEDEGISYYFRHGPAGSTLVLADGSRGFPEVPGASRVAFDPVAGGSRPDDRVWSWETSQEVRPARVVLRDHHFQLAQPIVERDRSVEGRVTVGRQSYALAAGDPSRLELYDFPGGFAHRLDGVGPGGGDRADDLGRVADEGSRAAGLRAEQEAFGGLIANGEGSCRRFTAGHAFRLERHGDADGAYLLTSVHHEVRFAGHYQSGQGGPSLYTNTFECTPPGLPVRPARRTPRPCVPGPQTGLVVGPQGEEIFTDKYGRVKVQFHWDRQGKLDANSSCWVRVGTLWAGTQWGTIHIPRIGQEVIVEFEEGDPDRPIITGSVYNAKMMPPYKLPDLKTKSIIKSNSTIGGTPDEANELTFEDKKGSEGVYFYAQKDFHRVVKNDDDLQVGHAQTISVENSIKMVAGTSNTQRAPNGYGGNAGLGAAGGGGGLGGLTKGTIEIDAGESITLKVGKTTLTLGPDGLKIEAPAVTIRSASQMTLDALTLSVQGKTSVNIFEVALFCDVCGRGGSSFLRNWAKWW